MSTNIRKRSTASVRENTDSLPWDDLRYVLEVAREGSLSGAARKLGVEHSTIFRRIEQIESRLDAQLFDRQRRGYVATATGELIAEAGRAMEQAALEAKRRVLGADSRLHGVVRIASSEPLGVNVLTPLLRDFLQQHPDIEVELTISNRHADLLRREADIALRATDRPNEDLVGREVATIRYALYASACQVEQQTIDPQQADWVGFDETVSQLRIARWMREQYPDAKVRLRADSMTSLAAAVGEGCGIGVLPCFIANLCPRLRRISPILEQPTMAIWLLAHPDVRRSARVHALMQHLMHEVPLRVQAMEQEGQTAHYQCRLPQKKRRSKRRMVTAKS